MKTTTTNDSLDVLVEAKAAVKKLTSYYGKREWYADPKISAVIRSATQLFVDLEVALYDLQKDLPSREKFRQDITCMAGVPTTPETVFVSGEKIRSMEEVPLKGEIKFKPKGRRNIK
jgi:hypothetical protein